MHARDGCGFTPLHVATGAGRGGQPAVHAAASGGGGGKCTGECAATSSGVTPLHAVSVAGQDAFVGLLVGVGVGVDVSGTSAATTHGVITTHRGCTLLAASHVRHACALCCSVTRSRRRRPVASPHRCTRRARLVAWNVRGVRGVRAAGGRRGQGGSDRARRWAMWHCTLPRSAKATPRACVYTLLAEGAHEQGSH